VTVDYLTKYLKGDVFDMSALINDDLMQPVRILFNAKQYVSSAKLLLVAIDTVSFVEYGETKENPFIKWLNTYADIPALGITPEELWEHRNGLLHMSSLTSRKVKAGNVRALVSYVGTIPTTVILDQRDTGYYDLRQLIKVFGAALGKWLDTYNVERHKFESFIQRYDHIASDARLQHFLV
jgi:hypothetical protein